VNGRHPTRRGALCCGAALAAGLFTGLVPNPAAASLNPFRNPCRGALPPDLAKHDLVLSAFDGIEASRLVDVHSHLLGTGDSGSGCSVNEQAFQWWHPTEVLRRKVIMNAACVVDEGAVDRAYVDGLVQQAEAFPAGARWWLFAFARAHDDQGRERADWTTFHVPNAYAAQVAGARPQRFRWVASVHPYAPTALQDLDAAIAGGAVAVKWLPSAMNIDLRDPRCRSVLRAPAACRAAADRALRRREGRARRRPRGTHRTRAPEPVRPAGQRRFAPFFWVQFLGAGNDNLFKFAFTVLVTYQLQVSWLPADRPGW
jgi:hypothetical protein